MEFNARNVSYATADFGNLPRHGSGQPTRDGPAVREQGAVFTTERIT
jgi:hypothetical protein